jgi:hypothetical protein
MAFTSRMRQLGWSVPTPSAARRVEAIEVERPQSPVAHAISTMRFAARRAVRSALDDATLLLQIAAEVEHAFLLQYLYAAYSLNDAVTPAADAAATLIDVAKQEMAHLVTVQNVLMSIGQCIDLSREDFSTHPEQYPFRRRSNR